MSAQTATAAIVENAARAPDRLAVALTAPGDPEVADSATFGELVGRAERFAAGLRDAGFRPGDRVLLATSVSIDFYALVLAVIGSGMSVVLIDGSLDRLRLLSALRSAKARGVVGNADALRRWWLVPPLMRMRRYSPGSPPRGVRPLHALLRPAEAVTLAIAPSEVPSSISFTSGSTGRAKGVVRSSDVALAQHRALLRHFPSADGDIDMPCFPGAVLHNLVRGVTSVLPPVDLRRPGDADPAAVAEAARRTGVTTLSGAPAYMTLLVDHLLATGERLPAVRFVGVGGAPVTAALCSRVLKAFPEADARAIYGSTEIEPIAQVAMAAVAAAPQDGLLVGAPIPEVEVLTVDLPDRVETELDRRSLEHARMPIGEVIVRGAGVSRAYIGDAAAFSRHKIREPDGTVWHRTGDIARLDERGRLWLLGRRGEVVTHRGRKLYPLPVEAAANELPGIRGAGLVAHPGAPEGELAVVATRPGALADLRARLQQEGLGELPVRAVSSIPMDRRHNSKVNRPELASRMAPARRGTRSTRTRS